MSFKYDKDSLKEQLTIEEVFDLVNELGGEPIMGDNSFTAKTICHGGDSHKLYYYNNSHLFHCYTGCGDASFDIYDLISKIYKLSLPQSIMFVAKYYGYTEDIFSFDKECLESSKDWQLIHKFIKNKERINFRPQVKLATYDSKILKYFPKPHIYKWEDEGIKYDVMLSRGICYDPVNEGIIIPHYNINNQLIGIRERTLVEEKEIYGKYRPALINNTLYNHPLGYNLYNLNNSQKAIQCIQKAIIFEGEKGCLTYASYFGTELDISVACCGSNLINYQVGLLLNLGVKEIIIAFDKQFQEKGDEEYQKWITKLKAIHNKYGNYVNISYMFDKDGELLNYKDSPIDKGKDIFMTLFKNRIMI